MARVGKRKREVKVTDTLNNGSDPIFDIHKLILDNGVGITYDELDVSVSGVIYNENGDWVIKVNKHEHPKRQRVVLAFLYGSYLLHSDEVNNFVCSSLLKPQNQIGIDSTDFALNLLIPERVVREQISKGVVAISELSEIFNVLPNVMKIRLKTLGYFLKYKLVMDNNKLRHYAAILGDKDLENLIDDLFKLKRKTKNQTEKIKALEKKLERYESESKYAEMRAYAKSLEQKNKSLKEYIEVCTNRYKMK